MKITLHLLYSDTADSGTAIQVFSTAAAYRAAQIALMTKHPAPKAQEYGDPATLDEEEFEQAWAEWSSYQSDRDEFYHVDEQEIEVPDHQLGRDLYECADCGREFTSGEERDDHFMSENCPKQHDRQRTQTLPAAT